MARFNMDLSSPATLYEKESLIQFIRELIKRIQSSQSLLNSYCGRPRGPRRRLGTALACMHCTVRTDRFKWFLKTQRQGAGEMAWWLRGILVEDQASVSITY